MSLFMKDPSAMIDPAKNEAWIWYPSTGSSQHAQRGACHILLSSTTTTWQIALGDNVCRNTLELILVVTGVPLLCILLFSGTGDEAHLTCGWKRTGFAVWGLHFCFDLELASDRWWYLLMLKLWVLCVWFVQWLKLWGRIENFEGSCTSCFQDIWKSNYIFSWGRWTSFCSLRWRLHDVLLIGTILIWFWWPNIRFCRCGHQSVVWMRI